MVIYWDLIGFHGDLLGFNDDLLGFERINRSSPNKLKQTCKSGLPRGMRHSHLYTLLGYVNANRAQMTTGCLTDVISLPKQVSIDLK